MSDTKTAEVLPDALEGHWVTPEGRDKALEYADKSRADLCKGHIPDLALANAIYLASRHDLDLIHYQPAAKERIRWLSVRVALLTAENESLRTAAAQAEGAE